jgi:hypothetical protein
MLSELKAYYSEIGILSTNFHCPYSDQCGSGSNGLIKGKSAFVGTEYERHSIPRTLFVSLDPGSDDSFETPQKRTPEGVREVEEHQNWQSFNPLLHWYATHKLAYLIARESDASIVLQDSTLFFAHTNSAKCCYVKKDHDMSGDVLYRNCRNFLRKEIDILDPDIIISQGQKALDAVASSSSEISKQVKYQPVVSIHDRIHVIIVNNHPVLWIQSIYPSWRNDRTRKQEKDLYPFYLDAVKEFLKLKS